MRIYLRMGLRAATMTMTPEALERSAKALLASVIADGRWLSPIEDLMSTIGVLGGGIARTVPPKMFALPSSGLRQQFADFQAGKAPVLREAAPLRPTFDQGFVADYMTPQHAVRVTDPFYQEFLRPRQCVNQVTALLDVTEAGQVTVMMYRTERQGPFESDDLALLRIILPYLRAATMVARASLSGEMRRQAEPFERRGEPVLYLGIEGRILDMNGAAEAANGRLFRTLGRRLIASLPADQRQLDAAVSRALVNGTPGLVTLACVAQSGQAMALVVPVLGDARDVLHAVFAIVVFIEKDRLTPPDKRSLFLLQEAARLTGRELDVVRSIASGRGPRETAMDLGIGLGTVRLHLKAAFAKCDVHSQAELAALIQRLG